MNIYFFENFHKNILFKTRYPAGYSVFSYYQISGCYSSRISGKISIWCIPHEKGEGVIKGSKGNLALSPHLAVNLDQPLLHGVHLLHSEGVLHPIPSTRTKIKLVLNECECVLM